MKEYSQTTGVKKWAGDELVELQHEPLYVLQRFFEECGMCVVQGCNVLPAGNLYNVLPGVVVLAGLDAHGKDTVKAVRFAGAENVSLPIYLTLSCNIEEEAYGDGKVKPFAYNYIATASAVKPAEGIPFLEIGTTGGRKFVDAVKITEKLDKIGNGKDVTVTFAEAAARENVATGEKLSMLFGKVRKFFADLKTVAFTGKAEDLTQDANNRLVTDAEKAGWNDKYTKVQTYTRTEVDNKDTAALQAAKDYTAQKIAEVVNSAPGTLDTLQELAAALGNDPNFATSIMALIGGKADLVHQHTIGQVTNLQSILDGKLGNSGEQTINGPILTLNSGDVCSYLLLNKKGANKAYFGLGSTVNEDAYIHCYNGGLQLTSSSQSTTVHGVLMVNPTTGSYSEGVRIASFNGWSNVNFGTDPAQVSGIATEGQWIVGKNPGHAFIICRAGEESTTTIPTIGLGISADGANLVFNNREVFRQGLMLVAALGAGGDNTNYGAVSATRPNDGLVSNYYSLIREGIVAKGIGLDSSNRLVFGSPRSGGGYYDYDSVLMNSDIAAWAKAANKPLYTFFDIADAPSQPVADGQVYRKVILTNQKPGGYVSRVALGLTNPANRFSPAILSVGRDDAGAIWTDFSFDVDGRISSLAGTFALTSEIPAIPDHLEILCAGVVNKNGTIEKSRGCNFNVVNYGAGAYGINHNQNTTSLIIQATSNEGNACYYNLENNKFCISSSYLDNKGLIVPCGFSFIAYKI